jgi:hypothetical protein
MTDKTEIWIIGIEGASVETFKRVKKELVKYKAPEDKYIIVPHQVSSIRIRMTDKPDSFEDRVQEFAKDLGAKRVEYMGFETKIVYALAIDEIGSLRSQLADARQRNIKLNEMLGKAQSRDSNTTNKKLRKEIGHKDEVIKWLAIHAEHINRLQPSGCYMVNFKFLEKPEDWIEAAEEAIKTK